MESEECSVGVSGLRDGGNRTKQTVGDLCCRWDEAGVQRPHSCDLADLEGVTGRRSRQQGSCTEDCSNEVA